MARKTICDYCLREIEADYTTMTIQTVGLDDATTVARTDADLFEFHAGCYNVLAGLIAQIRDSRPAEPLDPTPRGGPKEQPTRGDDPPPPAPLTEPAAVAETAPAPAAEPATTGGEA